MPERPEAAALGVEPSALAYPMRLEPALSAQMTVEGLDPYLDDPARLAAFFHVSSPSDLPVSGIDLPSGRRWAEAKDFEAVYVPGNPGHGLKNRLKIID